MVYENSMLLRTNTTPGHLCLWGNASSMAGEGCMHDVHSIVQSSTG